MSSPQRYRNTKLRWTLIILGCVLAVGLAMAWPSISDFLAQDDCLDAGGAWRHGACEGRRPGE